MKFSAIMLAFILCLAACFSGDVAVGQGGDTYSLQLQGYVWNHSTLSALVVTTENESWWNPSYVNDTLRAVGQWNNALEAYAGNYTDYAYLANLKINPRVSSEIRPGYDLYISWVESSISNMSDEVGLAQTFIRGDNTIINCTITLAAKTNHGVALSATDMQNIALHEVGHGLGLGHSNYTGDLMYSLYRLGDSPVAVSTLNVYGVAAVFGWMPNPSGFLPISGWFKQNSVSLSAQNYGYLWVAPENSPPQSLADNVVVQFLVLMWGLLLHPEIGLPVAGLILLFVVLVLIPRKRKPTVKVDS